MRWLGSQSGMCFTNASTALLNQLQPNKIEVFFVNFCTATTPHHRRCMRLLTVHFVADRIAIACYNLCICAKNDDFHIFFVPSDPGMTFWPDFWSLLDNNMMPWIFHDTSNDSTVQRLDRQTFANLRHRCACGNVIIIIIIISDSNNGLQQ